MIRPQDVESMNYPVALVTGANTGIGRVTALALARRGYRLILVGRSAQKTQPVLDEIAHISQAGPNHFVPVELDDLDSVRRCLRQILALDLPLHVLVNNAGIAGLSTSQAGRTGWPARSPGSFCKVPQDHSVEFLNTQYPNFVTFFLLNRLPSVSSTPRSAALRCIQALSRPTSGEACPLC
ncbi:MAG: SDR family NAD(P)-dependent oxidoreductase [Betaproteobacteria bacterium]|nr:SDR family NAD(P)-dependent oxidoreductase [Betaproteobacteria bacterium]